MSQVTTGLRRVLSDSRIYEFLQWLMGSHKARKKFVSDYIALHKVN
jgi:hypothetical protein